MLRIRFWIVVLLLLLQVSSLSATSTPGVIRIGAPSLPGQSQMLWGAVGIARAKGLFEQEFAKDGIRVEFPGFAGGGPMVAQALANGQIDFAGNGDMISIITKSAGIKSKLLLPAGRLENAYLLVKPNSSIHTLADLKGKKIAYFKGNYIQLQVIRILATQGLSEDDVRNVSLLGSNAINALRNGDVDAVFGGQETLAAADKGLAKIIYSTRNESARLTAQAGLLVNSDFASKYPDLTERVVKVIVQASRWASEDANRDAALALWSNGGLPNAKEDYAGRPLSDRLSPLLDPFFVAQYKDTQKLIAKLGLLRGDTVDIDRWFDRSYLTAALNQLQLQHYWTPLDADGHRIK